MNPITEATFAARGPSIFEKRSETKKAKDNRERQAKFAQKQREERGKKK